MTGIVVQNTVTLPGGNPYAFCTVTIALVTAVSGGAGYTSSGDIVSKFRTTTDIQGNWSVTLVPNSQITPANTYYQVTEGQAISPIVVPASGGPYTLSQLLVTPPPTPSAPGITGVQVAVGSTVKGVRPEVNLIAGTNVAISGVDNATTDSVDVTISATGAAFETNATNLQPSGVGALNGPSGASGKTVDSTHTHPAPPWEFWITNPAYGGGAKGTLNCVVDAVTNGTTVVTSASGKFTASMVNKPVAIKGGLTSGQSSLVTTVASYQSATQVTLSAAATSSATGLQMVWGDDDTAAIQATIDAAMAYGGNPFGIPARVVSPVAPGGLGYMVAGPLKNTDTASNALYNSQLTTGLHSDRYPPKVLEFWTPIYAGSTRHWNQDYPSFTGCTWFSTGVFSSQSAQSNSIVGVSGGFGGNPSVLGGPTGAHGYGVAGANPVYNNVTVRLVNMSIMNAYSNSGWTYSPFNFHGMARAHLKTSAFGTNGVVQYYTGAGGSGGNTDFSNPATFSGGLSLGGLMPSAGNNADNVIEDCVWQGGYTYGPLLTEHTTCKGINRSLYNWLGIGVAGLYGDGGTGTGSLHAIDLGQWCIEACSYHLGVWGAGASGIGPYIKGTLDTEGVVQVRGVTNVAANLQALSGEIHLVGSPSTPTFTFGTNLKLIMDTQVRGPVASPSYTLGTAQINSFYRDATVTISGGTVTAVKVSALAGGATAPTMTTIPGFTSGTFRVPSGCWWEIDGSVAPTSMQWILD